MNNLLTVEKVSKTFGALRASDGIDFEPALGFFKATLQKLFALVQAGVTDLEVLTPIREQSGGLKNVRALGLSIEDGRRAQVSMNLVNTDATPIHRVLALVRSEARSL